MTGTVAGNRQRENAGVQLGISSKPAARRRNRGIDEAPVLDRGSARQVGDRRSGPSRRIRSVIGRGRIGGQLPEIGMVEDRLSPSRRRPGRRWNPRASSRTVASSFNEAARKAQIETGRGSLTAAKHGPNAPCGGIAARRRSSADIALGLLAADLGADQLQPLRVAVGLARRAGGRRISRTDVVEAALATRSAADRGVRLGEIEEAASVGDLLDERIAPEARVPPPRWSARGTDGCSNCRRAG